MLISTTQLQQIRKIVPKVMEENTYSSGAPLEKYASLFDAHDGLSQDPGVHYSICYNTAVQSAFSPVVCMCECVCVLTGDRQ